MLSSTFSIPLLVWQGQKQITVQQPAAPNPPADEDRIANVVRCGCIAGGQQMRALEEPADALADREALAPVSVKTCRSACNLSLVSLSLLVCWTGDAVLCM